VSAPPTPVSQWLSDDQGPSPLVMKVRSRASSILSGASTPGGGTFKGLSERDLREADAALSQVNGAHIGSESSDNADAY
jgi:glycogen synthase